nr:protein lyl-1 isoform X1 [Castor canadensis]
MCPPQAEAEVGPTMTEKAKMVCAPSPVTTPPPKPASAGPLPTEEMRHQGGASPSRLPPGVPVISLGHTRPPGATMATTELSALRPPLLHLSALGTAPPTLALHYHPHPYLNSVYIGPAGPFSLFPSSRLKRRPSYCELDLAEERGVLALTHLHTEDSPHRSQPSSRPQSHRQPHSSTTTQQAKRHSLSHGHNRAWEPQNDSSPGMQQPATQPHKSTTEPHPRMKQPQPMATVGHNHSHQIDQESPSHTRTPTGPPWQTTSQNHEHSSHTGARSGAQRLLPRQTATRKYFPQGISATTVKGTESNVTVPRCLSLGSFRVCVLGAFGEGDLAARGSARHW